MKLLVTMLLVAAFLLAVWSVTGLMLPDDPDPEPAVEVEAQLIPPLNLEAPTTTSSQPPNITSTSLHRAHETAPIATVRPSGDVWAALAQCESGGRWDLAEGGHEGGLQFLGSTWLAAGGRRFAEHAYQATREQQIEIAKGWLARTSPRQWPVCGPRVGLTMADAA